MAQSSSSANWQKKGFGWIPDLPDIADPNLGIALDKKTRILTREDIENLEDVAQNLIELLHEKNVAGSEKLEGISNKILGETRFPEVKVYKVLKKGYPFQEREVSQLKQALCWLYESELIEYFNPIPKSKGNKKTIKNASSECIFEELRDKKTRLKWLQSSAFDTRLEEIVKYFQGQNNLVQDGVVGLITHKALEERIEKASTSYQRVDLLCPSSIVPHEVLGEIFQHLTYIWLHSKFENCISDIFESFFERHEINSNRSENVNKIKIELKFISKEKIRDFSCEFRREIEGLSQQSEMNFSAPLENLLENLKLLKDILVSKYKELTQTQIANNLEVNHSDTGLLDPNLVVNSVVGEPNSGYYLSILQNLQADLERDLDDCLKSLGKSKEIEPNILPGKPILGIEHSFIVYRASDFAAQFNRWFHVIEPFISAIFQILSPLANFDNYKQAVNAGFDRLDSCLQLYRLEYTSTLTTYKELLLESTSPQTQDQIEELQSIRKTIVDLFQETLAKIDRVQNENLKFRPLILESLQESLKSDVERDSADQSNDLAILLSERWLGYAKEDPNIDGSWFSKTLEQIEGKLENLKLGDNAKDILRPLALNFYQSKLFSLSDELPHLNKKDGSEVSEFLDKIFATNRKDIETYDCFFRFLKEIIRAKYKVNPAKTSTQTTADRKVKSGEASQMNKSELAELVSFLSTKREMFEIQDSSFTAAKSSASDRETKPSLLEPTILQLPINSSLMRKSNRKPQAKKSAEVRESRISYYFFLPSLVDLSYWFSPVEDQGNVNACTAFSGVALLEYFAQRRYGKYTNLSARFVYKTARNLMNRIDDTGASVRQTMKALVLFGVPPEESWPWHPEDFNEEPPAFCYAYAQSYQALKYFRLDAANTGANENLIASRELLLFQIKAVLAAGLPCVFGFTVYSSFYRDKNLRRGYIPYPSGRDQVVGGHAAVAVGYNDYKYIDRTDGEPAKSGAILIRNSWGPSWGNSGYGWMPYDYVLDGLTADWWSLLKSEWFDGGAFGLGAIDPGTSGGTRGSG